MYCDFQQIGDGTHRCQTCGLTLQGVKALPIISRCRGADAPPSPISDQAMPGPGSELKAIFIELGLVQGKACNCEAHAAQMNLWGIRGCRAFFDVIVGWLREDQAKFGWAEKLTAARKALTSGIALQLNWADPFPGLVELAIKRAEEKGVPVA